MTKPTRQPIGRTGGVQNRFGWMRLLGQIRTELVKEYADKKWQDYDPVVSMALIACDINNPVEIRLVAHARVAKFIHAEMKSVEPKAGEIEEASQYQMGLADRVVGALEHQKS